MDYEYDPLETDDDTSPQGCADETVLISIDDFYDLLMEQQEQM